MLDSDRFRSVICNKEVKNLIASDRANLKLIIGIDNCKLKTQWLTIGLQIQCIQLINYMQRQG